MSLLFLNTLTYGFAKLSRTLILIPVMLWYGIGPKADDFFLTYAIAAFVATTLVSTLGSVLVARLSEISWRDLVLVGFAPSVFYTTLVLVLNLPYGLYYIPFIGASAAAGILSGYSANQGRFKVPPFAQTVSGIVVISVAILMLYIGNYGVASLPISLSIGEMTRLAILVWTSRNTIQDEGGILGWSFWNGAFSLLLVTAALGSTQAISRLMSQDLGIGRIAMLGYAWGIIAVTITLLTSGILVTYGYQWRNRLPDVSLDWHLISLAVAVAGILAFTAGQLNARTELRFIATFSTILFFYAPAIPFFVITNKALATLVALEQDSFLLVTSLLYIVVLVLLIPFFASYLQFGILGVALTVTVTQVGLAISLQVASMYYLRKEKRIRKLA